MIVYVICLVRHHFTPAKSIKAPVVYDASSDRPDDSFRYFGWLSASLHWQGLFYAIYTPWLTTIGMHVRMDKCRMHGVNANSFFRNLSGQTWVSVSITPLDAA